MLYFYLKALHIIFVVTWFSGMFYMPRLFIYNTEANDKSEVVQKILHDQFQVMMKRLWYGITWPSAILTFILGPWVMFYNHWHTLLFEDAGKWLLIKWLFVVALLFYHLSLHRIFKQQMKMQFKYSSQQLRIWNEVATIFLVAIVLLATVKQSISWVWGIIGLAVFILILMFAIKIYKVIRDRKL